MRLQFEALYPAPLSLSLLPLFLGGAARASLAFRSPSPSSFLLLPPPPSSPLTPLPGI